MNSTLKSVLFWVGLVVAAVLIWNFATRYETRDHQLTFSEFMSAVDGGTVQRVVITGYSGLLNRVLMARFDESTGKLTLDERFRAAGSAEPGIRMEGITWPHGGSAAAIPHGAVFSRN